jgi:hypothetical protein
MLADGLFSNSILGPSAFGDSRNGNGLPAPSSGLAGVGNRVK